MSSPDFFVKCCCGCRTQVGINDFGDGQIEVNVRGDGRRRWVGAVVDPPVARKLIRFLIKVRIKNFFRSFVKNFKNFG